MCQNIGFNKNKSVKQHNGLGNEGILTVCSIFRGSQLEYQTIIYNAVREINEAEEEDLARRTN